MNFCCSRGVPKELEQEAYKALFPIFEKYLALRKKNLNPETIALIIEHVTHGLEQDCYIPR